MVPRQTISVGDTISVYQSIAAAAMAQKIARCGTDSNDRYRENSTSALVKDCRTSARHAAAGEDVTKPTGQASCNPKGRKLRNKLQWSAQATGGYGDLKPRVSA